MALHRPVILGIGELLWDMLPGGKKVGGAVANMIYFCRVLNAEAYLATAVGDDELGREMRKAWMGLELSDKLLQTDRDHPTGTVDIEVSAGGQPAYTIHENVAWDNIQADEELLAMARQADAVCFGSLGQRHPVSRAAIRAAVEAVSDKALIICDINLRQAFFNAEIIAWSLRAADIVKLNDEELPVVGKLLGLAGLQDDIIERMLAEYSIDLLALTAGSSGSYIYTSEGVCHHPGFPAEIKDTVGAGDSFTGALTIGALRKMNPEKINKQANRIAGYVCTQSGGTPDVPDRIKASLSI